LRASKSNSTSAQARHCESIADDMFEMQDDGIVLIHDNERPETDPDRMQQAVTQCPAAA
jgi:ferredoxin